MADIVTRSGKSFDTKNLGDKIEGGIYCCECGCRLGWTQYESSEYVICDDCAADLANGDD